MKKAHFFPKRWASADDIGDVDVLASIVRAGAEEVGQPPEEKCVVHFQAPLKPLICNGTNYDRIAAIAGSDDTDNWAGTKVVLYTELATFRGKTSPAIRVKAPPGGGVAASPTSKPSSKAAKTSTLEEDHIPF